MGESNTQVKTDEQYPLLKSDGSSDKHVQPTPTVGTPGWGIYTKASRFTRWPEFISACWMTLVLCGISFLVFHSLGMAFYRRQQFVIKKCNNSKPESNVYYHHIIQRGCQVPFVIYTEYLSNMAMQYPNLNFNVIFLLDDFGDALRNPKRNIPFYHSWMYNYQLDEMAREIINDFKRRYQNVNVTVTTLSKFMAMTPLKFRWRMIPQAYLSFYARVFSVWQTGGIAIDLRTYNNAYHNHIYTDSRIDAILRQHNNGINTDDYKKALHKIDNDEANAVFNMIAGLINDILKESRSFFNRTPPTPQTLSDKNTTMIRTLGRKLQTNNHSENTVTRFDNDTRKSNIFNTLNILPTNYTSYENLNISFETPQNGTNTDTTNKSSNTTDLRNSKGNLNGTQPHQLILFYDFSFISDNTAPSLPALLMQKQSYAPKTVPHLLSIDAEGTFIAASARFHPFLAHLFSSGRLGMHPKFAVQNTLLTQCSDVFKDNDYCKSIYVL